MKLTASPAMYTTNPSGVLNLLMGNATIRTLRRAGEVAYHVTYPDGTRGTVVITFDRQGRA